MRVYLQVSGPMALTKECPCVCVCVCVCARARVCESVCLFGCVCLFKRARACVRACARARVCVCVHACVSVKAREREGKEKKARRKRKLFLASKPDTTSTVRQESPSLLSSLSSSVVQTHWRTDRGSRDWRSCTASCTSARELDQSLIPKHAIITTLLFFFRTASAFNTLKTLDTF